MTTIAHLIKSSPERGGGSRRLTEGPLSARSCVESLRMPPADPSTTSWSPSPFRGGYWN
jgi:hypothetical protein